MKRFSLFVVGLAVIFSAAPLSAQTLRSSTETDPPELGFGNSLAVGDNEIVVGEPGNNITSGIVYIFRRGSGAAWSEAARLVSSDAETGDRFGSDIAIDGETLIVGSTQPDSGRGAAYVFQKTSAGVWVEVGRLSAEDGVAEDALGSAVAIGADMAMVGTTRHNDNTGAVYVFRRDPANGTWSQAAKLVGSAVTSGDRFGSSIAMDGDWALIASTRHDENTGAVYAFKYDRDTKVWQEVGSLVGGDIEKGNRFGSSIALHGTTALIGAPRVDRFIGAVYSFGYDEDSGEWEEQGKLVPFDGSRQNRFGTSLAFDGTYAWIGAPGARGFQGVVYLFEQREDLGWVGAAKLGLGDLQRGDFFAGTVAASSQMAVVGIPGDDYGAGTALVYQLTDGAWESAGKILSETRGMDPIVGGEVKCNDGTASLFDCSDVDLVAFLPVQAVGGGRGVRLNDTWGWTDPQTGREYAIVGRVDGTAFLDISDPYTPVYLGELPKTETAPGSTWRDMKVYKDHVFIVADGAREHGMQVFDLTELRGVRNPPVTFEETAHYDQIHSAHNIVINEETGYAYAVGSSAGGETCGGGLHMINIQDPARPTFAGCFADPETGRAGTGYSHDAMCVVYQGPDVEHQRKEICFGANETALSIADVSDKANPTALAHAAYPNVGYAHQGWISEDHRYFFLDDELDEISGTVDKTRTLVWDIADLDDPILLKEFFGETSASDHNLYVRGTLMYQSNYVAGLRIIDVSDPGNPKEVGYFDTVPYGENSPGFNGSWSNYPYFESGTIVVTSGREGVFLLRKREAPVP